MVKALLLDLDDTLLGNDMDVFMKHYFGMLNEYARPVLDERTFLPYLIQATQAAIADTNPALTNADVFWSTFEQLSGRGRAELEPFFNDFYTNHFPDLERYCEQLPAATKVIAAAEGRGLTVVIATNPLFPMAAVEQRLDWAGLTPADHAFALVTAYENMHATKPQPAYYREILDHLGIHPREAIMVGDDWENDIAPAASLGLFTYWIAPPDQPAPDPALATGRGSLDAFAALLADGWPAAASN